MNVISPRWLYFWLFAWLAGHGRFTSLLLEDRGLNEIQIGILLSMNAVISIISAPVICNYADHIVNSGRRAGYELVVAVCAIIVSVAFCMQYISEYGLFDGDNSNAKFIFFAVLRVIYSIFLAPIYAIVDGMAVQYLVDAGLDKAAFGNERLFGAVSWAIVNFIMGICIDRYGTVVMYLFTLGFLLSLLYCIAHFASSRMSLPHHPVHHHSPLPTEEEEQEEEVGATIIATTMSPRGGDIEMKMTAASSSSRIIGTHAMNEKEAEEDDVFYDDIEESGSKISSSSRMMNSRDDAPLLGKAGSPTKIPSPSPSSSPLVVMNSSMESRDDVLEDDLEGLVLPSASSDNSSASSSDSSSSMSSHSGTKKQSELITMLGLIFSSSASVAFVLIFAVLSSMTSIVENLVFILFRDTLGSSNFICGVSVVVTVVFEIPLFAYSKHMLDRFGQNYLMVIACICYIVRVVGYTYAPSGFWILLVEPMHGVTYACSKVASVNFVADIAPDGMQATAQGILSSLAAVGKLLGTSVGGYVEETYGSDALYRGAAVLLSVVLAAFVAALVHNNRISARIGI